MIICLSFSTPPASYSIHILVLKVAPLAPTIIIFQETKIPTISSHLLMYKSVSVWNAPAYKVCGITFFFYQIPIGTSITFLPRFPNGPFLTDHALSHTRLFYYALQGMLLLSFKSSIKANSWQYCNICLSGLSNLFWSSGLNSRSLSIRNKPIVDGLTVHISIGGYRLTWYLYFRVDLWPFVPQGGHSGTEGGRTFVTYFAEEGVFF